MDRLMRQLMRRTPLARASAGLVVLGIALSGWAPWDIATESGLVAAAASVPPTMYQTAYLPDSQAPRPTVNRNAYPAKPKRGQIFGKLTIPRLRQSFPLVQGTGNRELKRGVGHMVQTVMPGVADNCVISAHRDTFFARLGRVKKGDMLLVETAAGRFSYRVSRIRIVHKRDRTVVVHTGRPVLTVSTCYPFRYVGSAPDRYVLVADLVPNR